jgi:hypothetical protein
MGENIKNHISDKGVLSRLRKESIQDGPQWLTPVIPATQEALRSGGPRSEASLGKQFARPYLKNTQYKKGLVEWLKWYSTCLAR